MWRLWRRAIDTVCGSVQDIGYAHIAEIARLQPGGEAHLPGVRVVHEAGRLVFLPAPGGEIATVMIPQQPLPVPGRLCLPEASCCLTTLLHSGRLPLAGGDVAVLDADAVHGPLSVRSWLPGDRFRPFGAPGSRTVQDIFVDARVPRRLRTRIPLVLDEEGILWIAGFRLADRVKIKASTTQSLRIQIEWELNPWTLKRSNVALSPTSATNSVSSAPPDA
jgi:tRNA(Ile)-lysidine synthase